MPALTDRQRQVLRLVALTNREIGMRLEIGYQTVKNHLSDIYRVLGLDSSPAGKRTPALLLALAQGWIALDEIEPPSPPPGWDWHRFEQAQAAAEREQKNVLARSG